VIFVDTNVFMYAVGRPHPLRDEARAFFDKTLREREVLVTSVEVLQELLHAYLTVGRIAELDGALALAHARISTIWRFEPEDFELARALAEVEDGLGARDLIHLASARRRAVRAIKTYDRALAAASARL
jgi:uncharacterized protein